MSGFAFQLIQLFPLFTDCSQETQELWVNVTHLSNAIRWIMAWLYPTSSLSLAPEPKRKTHTAGDAESVSKKSFGVFVQHHNLTRKP